MTWGNKKGQRGCTRRRKFGEEEKKTLIQKKYLVKLTKMVLANKEMVVYCFDTLIAHYNSEEAAPAAFDEGQQ